MLVLGCEFRVKPCPERGWSASSLLSTLGILALKRSQWLGHSFLQASFADWRCFTSAVTELLNSYTLPRAAALAPGKAVSPGAPGTLGTWFLRGSFFIHGASIILGTC